MIELSVRNGLVTHSSNDGHANGNEEGEIGRESTTAASEVDETLPVAAASNGAIVEPVNTLGPSDAELTELGDPYDPLYGLVLAEAAL